MPQIDIDGLSEVELYELSGRIYKRLTALERKRERAAMAQYRPGLRVIIDAPGCGLVSGKVVRPTRRLSPFRLRRVRYGEFRRPVWPLLTKS